MAAIHISLHLTFILMVVDPYSVFGLDQTYGRLNFNPDGFKGVKASIQKMRSLAFGCSGLDLGDANITCTHAKLEKRYGDGLDCTSNVPVKTQAAFLNCPPGFGLVEEYKVITCKFPGKWDNEMFTCDEISTDAPTTTKLTTKAANATIKSTPKSTAKAANTTKPANTTTTTTKPANTTTKAASTVSISATTAASITSMSSSTVVAPTLPPAAAPTITSSTVATATTAADSATAITSPASITTTTPTPTTTPTTTTTTTTAATTTPTTTTTTTAATTTLDTPTPTTTTISPNNMGFGFQFENSIYNKYGNGSISFTWDDAETKCISVGAHLVIIDKEEEHKHIATHFFVLRTNWTYFTGLDAKLVSKDFVPVNGLPKSSYPGFCPGQPDDYNNSERCAEVKFELLSILPLSYSTCINDLPCQSKKNHFICEKGVVTK